MPTRRGWKWDATNSKLILYVNGTEVASFVSTGGTHPLAETITGKLTCNGSIDVGSAGVIAGIGTGANGIKLKNPKNAAASALSGTQLDVEIDIGGTPYYFTVYPTKA